MRIPKVLCAFSILSATYAFAADSTVGTPDNYQQAKTYLEKRTTEFDQIPAERKSELKKIAQYVESQSNGNRPIRLTFICTHNSRRSHLP